VIILALSILIVFLGAQVILRLFDNGDAKFRIYANLRIRRVRIYKYLFWVAVFATFLIATFQSYQQYRIWNDSELTRGLLPPYQGAGYFLFYAGTRFFASYAIALIAALVFALAAKILNKKFNERFFEPEEIWLGAAATFLSGHPGWLFYVILLLTFYLLIQIGSIIIARDSSSRISLYWLWIPTAMFVIIIINWLQSVPLWNILKI